MINEATAANIRRKSAFVDKVQMRDGVPLPSWIDLNLTELCNRACVFCPRVDPDLYPNQALHMSLELVRKIVLDLRRIDYRGAVVLCGYGEPMLHPRFVELVGMLANKPWRLELVTNGDRLTVDMVRQLSDLVDCFVVSMYDGPHQVAHFRDIFQQGDPIGWDIQVALESGGAVSYILRDRWHTAADAFGLKLTNRAGTVDVGDQDAVPAPGRPCNYLAYQMTVDWNGDVLLCPQDWHKKVKFGNLAQQSIMEVWTSRQMSARRLRLLGGRRDQSPCVGCNTDGCLHGQNHGPAWRREP